MFGGGRGRMMTPAQMKNSQELQEEKVDKIVSKQDARYDAMTEEEREQYYMKPSITTRIKKALRGQ
jgi:hypothetical protein